MPNSSNRLPVKVELARRNGALSRGPISAWGKARSALNATWNGLCARALALKDGEDAAGLAALRAALVARHQPQDAAEAHWVEELLFELWRQRRLRVLEDAALADGPAGRGQPSLATLLRYRGRLAGTRAGRSRHWRPCGMAGPRRQGGPRARARRPP